MKFLILESFVTACRVILGTLMYFMNTNISLIIQFEIRIISDLIIDSSFFHLFLPNFL